MIGNLAPGRGESPWKWAAETRPFGIANSWRTNIDIQGGFSSVESIISCQRRLSGNGSWCPSGYPAPGTPTGDEPGAPCPAVDCGSPGQRPCPGPEHYAGPGHFNDMDMLIVGTTTNLAPPFCKNCSCRPGPARKPICTGCDGCARPKVWDALTVEESRAQSKLPRPPKHTPVPIVPPMHQRQRQDQQLPPHPCRLQQRSPPPPATAAATICRQRASVCQSQPWLCADIVTSCALELELVAAALPHRLCRPTAPSPHRPVAPLVMTVSMWTILKSPLLASADLLAVDQSIIDVLANPEVLAVSDDPLGLEGLRLGDSGRQDKSTGEIYVGEMEHGRFAVVMFNRDWHNVTMTLQEEDLHTLGGWTPGGWTVRDLWQHSDNGTLAVGGAITMDVDRVVMFQLSPATL